MRRRLKQLALPTLEVSPPDAHSPMPADYIRIVHPPGAPVAAVAGMWWQREDGAVIALYKPEELELCREIIKE